jgi:hypothetical protein
MNHQKQYTSQLSAGMGVINETRTLLNLWQPGMTASALNQTALDSGEFPNITARRLRNIVAECFAPRYLVKNDYPAAVLKKLLPALSSSEFAQVLFLFTARANLILIDFVKQVYWAAYSAGQDTIHNKEAQAFVLQANQAGKTIRSWSGPTMQRAAGYLTGCCADFGMLEKGQKSLRKILPFQIQPKTIAFLAYDLHFQGLGNNAVVAHPDWQLFGLEKADLKEELKRLSLKGFFIVQSAGDVISIGWNYKSWEELIHVIAQR